MLKVLDLFSGIGGLSLGLERTGGFETVAFCEIDPYCRKVLKKHWPDVPIYEDVEHMEFIEGGADVITAGFPCQDISNAGGGAGITGPRSGLWRHVARAIRMVRPRWAVLENVAALLTRGMGKVLGDLAEVGHDADWGCLSVADLGGFHERSRVFIVTHSTGIRQPEQGHTWAHAGCRPPKIEWETNHAVDALRRSAVPVLCREAHGLPGRVHRNTALGNAVSPHKPELIGHAILEAEGISP